MSRRRTCAELGACQSRMPCCTGCRWQLAPGVIDGPHHARRRGWWRRMPRPGTVILIVFCASAFAALAATIGFSAGYLSMVLRGWL